MNRRSTKNLKKTRKAARKQPTLMCMTHPPPIQNFEVKHSTRLRFITNAAFAGDITYANLLDLICFATTALAPYDVFTLVKIKEIECWQQPLPGSSTSVSVIFNGGVAGSVGDSASHTDTSMGIEPAHLKVKPTAKSLASNYQISNIVNNAFYLNVPSGAVVDVALSFRGSTLGLAVPAQNASVGANVGQTFWRGLDGKAVATTSFLLPGGISQF